jgi:hypothetical protein
MKTLAEIFVEYWWLLLIFGGAVLDFIAETFGVGIGAVRAWARRKRKRLEAARRHQLKLRQLELEIARAQAGQAATLAVAGQPKPGPCVHRNVSQVVDANDVLVAWLCKGCSAQLPADWAVRAEDL